MDQRFLGRANWASGGVSVADPPIPREGPVPPAHEFNDILVIKTIFALILLGFGFILMYDRQNEKNKLTT